MSNVIKNYTILTIYPIGGCCGSDAPPEQPNCPSRLGIHGMTLKNCVTSRAPKWLTQPKEANRQGGPTKHQLQQRIHLQSDQHQPVVRAIHHTCAQCGNVRWRPTQSTMDTPEKRDGPPSKRSTKGKTINS